MQTHVESVLAKSRIVSAMLALFTLLALPGAGPASASGGGSALTCILAGQPGAGRGPGKPAPTSPHQSVQAYIHTSTTSNIATDPCVLDSTYLENPALNGQPNTKFFAIENSMPYGYGNQADRPLGVWYDDAPNRWAIYNDDRSNMAPNRSFNVFIPPQDSTLIVHTSQLSNTTLAQTTINDPQFNNQPNAVIFVQHVYNPGDVGGNYYTHTVAVRYDAGVQKWAIRNEDGTNFPTGSTFFALKASGDETAFTHTVTAASATFGYASALDSPLLNDNPDAEVLVTQNWGAGVANNHRVGVGYYAPTQRWYIFNQDSGFLPLGAMFNVLVVPPKSGYFVQEATADNTAGNAVFIGAVIFGNPDLDGHPEALIYVTHTWNPPESNNQMYHNHPIGVQYIHGIWAIVNLDGAFMQQGLTFNVYYTWPRGNSFSASASNFNSSGSSLTLNSPLLNSHPSAAPIAGFNASPAGQPGVITYTQPAGLRYDNLGSAWQVFNNSGPTFAITQTYNVLVAPGSFVVTATAPSFDHFLIDSPLTNNNAWALVFATPRDNGGINQKNTGVYYDTDARKWAIYNEDLSLMAANVVYDVFVTRLRLYLPLIRR